MRLTILGCYSATPRANAHTTSQVLEIKNHTFLIDCGEGTQRQLRKYKISFSRIKHIFISHLHGDHVYGLIGFISSLGLLSRESDLHIYGPAGIKEFILTQLKLSASRTPFSLYFHELSGTQPEIVYEDKKVSVETIPLDHRIYTNGYLFREKEGDRRLLIDEVRKYPIDIAFYNSIKKGKDFLLDSGELIGNEKLTAPPAPAKSYAFCSDTAFKPAIIPQLKNVTALYHESTFLEDNKELCLVTKHSTALQAAEIADKAQVKKLILGHYSGRYKNIKVFQEEAQKIFPHSELARDGKVFEL